MNTPTLEFRLSFHVPGTDVASLAAGTTVLAALQKMLSEHGCELKLDAIYPTQKRAEDTLSCTGAGTPVETRPDTPETRAADTASEQQEAAEAAAEPPAPEPEKPKRSRKAAEPKAETPPVQEQPAPEPELEKAPEAPAADLMDGSVCCEHLSVLHRTGGAEAAAAKIPGGWAVIPGLIQARGYSGLTAIKAALKVPETAAQATADVNAILAEARASYAGLEQAIAAKKEAEASELD